MMCLTGMSIYAVAIGGAKSGIVHESDVRVWQDGARLLIQRAGGHVTLSAPGPYNSYPDYRILSRSGRILAFPVNTASGWELDCINLATKKVTTLERGKSAYWARVSSSDRFLSALVDGVYTVFDLATGKERMLDSKIKSEVWSRTGDVLFFRKADGPIRAFDARADKLFEPSPTQIDREVGKAYRMFVPNLAVAPPAEVSSDGEFAFIGALKGGSVPIPVNGHYHGEFGITEPYRYGVMDGRCMTRSFAAPEEYRRQELYPLGWTRSKTLVFAIDGYPDRLLEYNPRSARVVIEKLKPPADRATLIAMGGRRLIGCLRPQLSRSIGWRHPCPLHTDSPNRRCTSKMET